MVGPSSGSRLAGIEGLRAIAAVSIVITHVWAFSMPDGAVLGSGRWVADALSALAVGVTLFFTLSGFLLYRPFAASIARGVPYVPIRSYFWNRFLRIAPAYWAILAISALLLASVYVRDAGGHLGTGRLADPLELLQAALLLQDYHPRTMIIGIGPACFWSWRRSGRRGSPTTGAVAYSCFSPRRCCSCWSVSPASSPFGISCQPRRRLATRATGIQYSSGASGHRRTCSASAWRSR
jgi:hypothetical protein